MPSDPVDVRSGEVRYRVVDHTGLSVEVYGPDEDIDSFDAELLDISTGGALLRVSRSLRDNNSHTVRISSEELSGPIYLDVQVCSSRLKGNGDWWIGCAFHPRIPEDVLDGLTSAGVIDRREDRRQAIAIDALAQWELESEQAPVRIVDVSREGFCLTSSRSGMPGSRVLLRIEDENQETIITARIRWQVEEENGYVIGCEVGHKFRPVLRKLSDTMTETPSIPVWKRLLGRS